MSHHMMFVMFISGAALAGPPTLICAGFIVFIIRQRRQEAEASAKAARSAGE
jgi:hypothetical protein